MDVRRLMRDDVNGQSYGVRYYKDPCLCDLVFNKCRVTSVANVSQSRWIDGAEVEL